MIYIKWLPCFIFPSISLLFKLYYRQDNENLEDVKLHLIDTLKVSLSPKAKKQISWGSITFYKQIVSDQDQHNHESGVDKIEWMTNIYSFYTIRVLFR